MRQLPLVVLWSLVFEASANPLHPQRAITTCATSLDPEVSGGLQTW
jgi:hypothetical protein